SVGFCSEFTVEESDSEFLCVPILLAANLVALVEKPGDLDGEGALTEKLGDLDGEVELTFDSPFSVSLPPFMEASTSSFSSAAFLRFLSSELRANASTSEVAFTERVDDGRITLGRGSRAHVSNSSPQKSLGPMLIELKKPVRPPFVVYESRFPRMMNSISFTGSPSRIIQVPSVHREGLRRSQMASSMLSSI
ncbi:hypothetical protein Leryth_016436, partial [Lithospermum erythrorhizon]